MLLKKILRKRYYHKIFLENEEKIKKLFEMLCDEKSKSTVRNILHSYEAVFRSPMFYLNLAAADECVEHHFFLDSGYEVKGTTSPYFDADIFDFPEKLIMLDGGAYIGDSIIEMIRNVKSNDFFVYAFEPNQKNFEKLKKNTEEYATKISYYMLGLGLKRQKAFFMDNDAGSRIVDDFNQASYEIEVMPASQILGKCIDRSPNFIKLDIEGNEKEVIGDLSEYIGQKKPDMAIGIYHSLEDLWQIPLMLNQICGDYHIYIRHQSNYYTETICYATIGRRREKV